MTREQIEAWKVERDIARKSGDAALMQKAYDHRDDMMMECIQHQADRVKISLKNDERIESDLATMRAQLAPCVETDKEFRETKLKAAGARWALTAMAGVVSVVGPVIAIKICKVLGVLW